MENWWKNDGKIMEKWCKMVVKCCIIDVKLMWTLSNYGKMLEKWCKNDGWMT